MAVPKFFEFFEAFLFVLKDGEMHTSKDIKQEIADYMELSDEDLAEMLPSGKQSTFYNRVMWARTYLDKAELIETPLRGRYRITDKGKTALASGEKIDLKYLEKTEAFKEFHKATVSKEDGNTKKDEEYESPAEILDAAYRQVNETLASELMDEVMKLTSAEFERLVVKLLLGMGYGSGIDNAGMVTKQSKDGGIDGVIKEDQLGFGHIYIQAKQWNLDMTVGKPEIQKFVGALQGQQAQRGLFITTARFSSGAEEYAGNLLGVKVVLVDGSALTKLMIKHNIGVSPEHVYEVKKIDSDFFADEL